jgi:hypothetical protein
MPLKVAQHEVRVVQPGPGAAVTAPLHAAISATTPLSPAKV